MKTLILAAVAALTVATPALAQDRAPFTGPRAEGVIGYDKVDINVDGVSNPDGLMYGGAIGYDVQLGGLVVGAEGEYTDSDANISAVGARVDAARDLYAGGRVGFATGPGLLYAKVGYTNARFKGTSAGISDSTNLDGVRVGGGMEFAIARNLYAKAEYRYSNYSDDVERHQVVGGVGIRF